jgi:adenosylhomocysteine nucleosidase
MGDKPRTIILTALRAEARAIGEIPGVEVYVIGFGAPRVPEVPSGARVIMAGLGGALDPSLSVGDLVLDTPMPDLKKDLPWHVGGIHTARHVVATLAEKAALFRETGALAVDMEQETVRRAVPRDVDLIGIRAIIDPADMAIDPAVLRFVDDVGRPRPLALASSLLRRPGLVPHLLELRANSAVALRNLGLGVRALLDRFPPGGRLAYASPD